MNKIAIFPGTFDPFTLGHASLVRRGLGIVDKIIIAIGVNDSKKNYFSLEERIQMIQTLYQDNDRVSVISYTNLTVDLAKEIGSGIILRGIRSVNDFEYERSIADINRKISGVETILLFTDPELAYISSTIVRELLRFGHSIADFVPEGMGIVINKKND